MAFDKDGRVIGRVNANGDVVDKDGKVIGRVNENGEVVSADGKVIGYAKKPSWYKRPGALPEIGIASL